MKIQRYKHDSTCSYALGMTLTMELLLKKPEAARMVYVSPEIEKNQNYDAMEALCRERNIPLVMNEKAFNILSPKGNCFVIGVFEKFRERLSDGNHIVLVEPSDAGNLGTIIRTATGFGLKDLAIIRTSAATGVQKPTAIDVNGNRGNREPTAADVYENRENREPLATDVYENRENRKPSATDVNGNRGNPKTAAEAAQRSSSSETGKEERVSQRAAVDIFDPKVVRASMGSIFRIRFAYFDTYGDYQAAYPDRHGYPFMLQETSRSIHDVTFEEPFSLIFGNEATGLPDTFAELPGLQPVIIPHSNEIDSLNLSMAAGIGMYEATKSRNPG